MDIAMTRVSSKGQVVLPMDARDEAGFVEGEKLLVYSSKNMIILKKMESPEKEFQKLAQFGAQFARQKRIKKSDVLKDD